MNPWIFFWSPQFYFPWSGDVAQRIAPNTKWFSELIKPGAGDPEIEEKAFYVASYGKQLGIIAEVLIDLAEQAEFKTPEAQKAFAQLKAINAEVEKLKQQTRYESVDSLIASIETLKNCNPSDYEALRLRFENLEAKK